jgi:hypothetical protein
MEFSYKIETPYPYQGVPIPRHSSLTPSLGCVYSGVLTLKGKGHPPAIEGGGHRTPYKGTGRVSHFLTENPREFHMRATGISKISFASDPP